MSNQLQNKLHQFETTPPAAVWSAIEERLSNSQPALQERLYAYEAKPPASAWNDIATSLENSSSVQNKTTPFFPNKWFRYAAAAVILGAVAFGILNYAIQKPASTVAQQPLFKKEQPVLQQPTNTVVASNASKTKNTAPEKIIPIKEESIRVPATTEKDQASTITKRYKVVAKQDGKLVRLSQKAYAVFDCAVKGSAQNGITCKENIQTMQAKMASSLVSPTTDFAGLIDMIKTLEENK